MAPRVTTDETGEEPTQPSNALETVIPPEVIADELADWLTRLCASERLVNVLEIGSSSGDGSTAAIVAGLSKNPNRARLFCLEMVRSRYEALKRRFANDDFVVCYRASSVPPESFLSEAEVAKFFDEVDTDLKQYGLGTVLQWRAKQLAYVRENVDVTEGINRIKSDFEIDNFDLVFMDGCQFTGEQDFKRVYGAKWILLDDINTLKSYAAWSSLKADPNYELIHENHALRHGFAVFRRRAVGKTSLPVHFFTLVLNGEPFIRYHVSEFSKLPFDWHWHIVEGVAELNRDSSWAAALGGKVPESANRGGLSCDGTSEYLDALQREMPGRVTVIRKQGGHYWDGKIEMCNTAISDLAEECLLWEVDVDELWTSEQIEIVRRAFMDNPDRTAAYYWCNFFVGPSRIISTRYNYAQNPNQEWLRTWRFKPGMWWASHSPPVLAMKGEDGAQVDVAKIHAFNQDETEALGAVFDHCAYVLESQVAFKETYYGYKGATKEWRALQADTDVPGFVADHFSWVTDRTMFDDTARRLVSSPVAFDRGSNKWVVTPKLQRGREVEELRARAQQTAKLRIVMDGLCFQVGDPELTRMWTSFLEAWLASGFADNLVLLDRGGTAPRFKGLATRSVRPYVSVPFGEDHRFLTRICDEEAATIFVSTGPSFPIETPSVHVAAGIASSNLDAEIRQKDYPVLHATSLVAFSPGTAKDLALVQKQRHSESIHVIPPGPMAVFGAAGAVDNSTFLKIS